MTRRDFQDGTLEWCSVGEVPDGVTAPTVIDRVTGEARMHGLDVHTQDTWICCFCEDGTHPESEFMQRETWGDSEQVITPAWRTDPHEAVRDLRTTAGHAHIVTRPGRVITGPIAVVEVA